MNRGQDRAELGLDDWVADFIAAGETKVRAAYLKAGKPVDEVRDVVRNAILATAEDQAESIADDLRQGIPDLASQARSERLGFNDRLREHWGPALDGLYAVAHSATEIGNEIQSRGEEDANKHVLLNLHARGCLTAMEVHSLLSSGFPTGALARTRTLHEIVVVAQFIGEYGRTEGNEDLAQRYLDHNDVSRYQEAKTYQANAERLGYEPFPDEDMSAYRAAYEETLRRYGSGFKEPNGWAARVVGNTRPKFSDLERMADFAHLRGHYKWASHFVHATPNGMTLNIYPRGDQVFRMVGPTNIHLSDPGILAMGSILDVTMALALYHHPKAPRLTDLVAVSALRNLVRSIEPRFLAGDDSVEAAEERFQATIRESADEEATSQPATEA